MKVTVFSVALGILSLVISPSRAQSQDLVVEPLPQSSSWQATQQSEIVMPTKQTDLPEAPQATPTKAGGPAFQPGMGMPPLLPQNFHDKFMAYAVITVGPRALFVPAIPAAIRMANPPSHYPNEWRQGAEGFGRNYGDQLATMSAFQTGRFAVGAALHENLRYHPSTSTNFFKRTGHALVFNFIDRSDDGHARLAVANFAGLAGGSYIGMSYLPTGFNDVTHADQRLAIQFGRLAGSNLGAEFAPDLIRFAIKHHLPRPQLPIPEWWVKR